MKVTPIRFTEDVAAMRRFCVALGLSVDIESDDGGWVALVGSGGGVGLHSAATAESPQPGGSTGLGFEADEPLEAIQARLAAAGFESAVIDEAFGRSLRTVDPDGLEVHVHEPQTDLHGYHREDRTAETD